MNDLSVEVSLVFVGCCECGTTFGMESNFTRRRREDHKTFYCPNRHGQHFASESEA